MIVKKIIQTIALTTLFYSCDPYDNRLIVSNKSNDTIFWYVRNKNEFPLSNDIRSKPFLYRNRKYDERTLAGDYIIPQQKKNDWFPGTNGWENHVKASPDGKLRIFIFKKSLLDTTKWESLVEKKMYTEKLEYTLDELNKMNWEVVYK